MNNPKFDIELLLSPLMFNKRFQSQETILISLRLPVEIIAWLDVLQSRGFGVNRSDVIRKLLVVSYESIKELTGKDLL